MEKCLNADRCLVVKDVQHDKICFEDEFVNQPMKPAPDRSIDPPVCCSDRCIGLPNGDDQHTADFVIASKVHRALRSSVDD